VTTQDAHPPRYAQTRTVYAVMLWDKHDRPEVICTSEPLAQDYINGQWSDEGYSIKPITLVEALPERRPLWLLRGRLPYPTGDPTREHDDFAAEGEFPGLGNGGAVMLDETNGTLEHHRGGWHVSVASWDQAAADARFDELMGQARQARTALTERFGQYAPKTIVAAGDNRVFRRAHDQFGTPWWADMDAHVGVYDYDIDPDTALTVLREGDAG
jgi:hypothetical protein